MARWYCSFHGGEGPHAWNNLHVFSTEGEPLGKALDAHGLPHGVALRELRGFAFGPDGDLYLANAYQRRSQILRFAGERDGRGRHPFREVFVAREPADEALAHPFHVAFDPDGHLYVPNQDSNTVARYFGPLAAGAERGAPMPHPPALRAWPPGAFRPGVFVPSAKRVAGGLRAVRHVAFGPDRRLYVADRAADAVAAYDPESGERLTVYTGHHLRAPIHLLPWPERGALLVGSRDRDAVLAIDLASGEIAPLVAPGAGGLKAPAGLAWGPDRLLYVASRTGRAVLRFDPATGKPAGEPLLRDLPDQPEFLLLVPD